MLIAMETSGGKVPNLVRPAIHLGFLVFNRGARRTALREPATAITAFSVLALNQMAAHPRPILTIIF
jgi:hypothetical protein